MICKVKVIYIYFEQKIDQEKCDLVSQWRREK